MTTSFTILVRTKLQSSSAESGTICLKRLRAWESAFQPPGMDTHHPVPFKSATLLRVNPRRGGSQAHFDRDSREGMAQRVRTDREIGPVSATARPATLLRRPDVHSARAFFAVFEIKLHVVSFAETLKIEVLKAAAMEKNFLSFGGAYEPESAVADDALDCTLHGYPRLRRGEVVSASRNPKQGGRRETLLRFGDTLPIRNINVKGQVMRRNRSGRL